MKIYTPEGRVGPPPATTAAAIASLRGKRIGILDNRKPQARELLLRLGERLAEQTGAEVVMIESKNAAIAAPDEVLNHLRQEVDLVLTGSAD